jgi:transposase
MKTYSDELKAGIIAKMLPPNDASVSELSRKTGIPKDTLYAWRLKARGHRLASKSNSGGLSSEDKFNIVVETASMNEEELSAYCCKKGLYPDQVKSWRQQCAKANEALISKADRLRARQQEQQIKQLKTELNRKEKALAEAAALLVLKKKVQEIWGEPEDD